MDIQDYINAKYDGELNWFAEEVASIYHQKRIKNIIDIKSYLSGNHAILNNSTIQWGGKTLEGRAILLNYAPTILNFEVSYLLKNPVTLMSEDTTTLKEIKRVYKAGKFNRQDFDILDKMVKFGNVYEYIYQDGEKIKSKLFDPADSYPVFNDDGEMVAFIENWTTLDNISYYNVFYPDRVEKWSNEGGLHLIGSFNNPSGLPCVYKNLNEEDPCIGRSDIETWVNVIDNMEDLISKGTDALYKYINGLPVVIGQPMNMGTDQVKAINQNISGYAISLDSDSDFKIVTNQIDNDAFKTIFNILKQALLDTSQTPGISMNSMTINNVSTESIEMLYSLANIKAALNQRFLLEGFEQRFEKIGQLLALQGIEIDSDNIEVVFQIDTPRNTKELCENLKTLNDIGSMSLESILANSPYIYDVDLELQRLKSTDTQTNTDNEDTLVNK